jgi:inosose dehydratase
VTVVLAGAPVSWGVDFAGAPGNPPPDVVFAGIAAAGLRWAELGPPGFLAQRRDALSAHGLSSAGTFVFERFHVPGARPEILAAARDALDRLELHGGRRLVLVDRPSGRRAATAGRSGAAERLGDAAWRGMIGTIRRVAALASECGVRVVVHPHAGTRIEFADEVARLLADLAPDEAGLCLDTGHALYAGDDPSALLREHAGRVAHLHVKDVDRARLAAARAGGQDFWTAIARGVFCPVGEGALDLPAFARALAASGYAGFATIEQDRRPGSPGVPAADLRVSVERLRAAGIGRLDAA